MANDTHIDLDRLEDQLAALDAQCPSSTLVFHEPAPEHESFFNDLCRVYFKASDRQRQSIRIAVSGKKGLLNCLLGYVYQAAELLRATGDRRWLQIGLAAAAMQGDGSDYRDFLLSLAELYVTAEEAGIDPKPEVEALGEGIPLGFDSYPVVRERRQSPR